MADDENALDEIRRKARADRTGPSRAMWIVALVIGGACAIGFALMLFADPAAPSTTPRTVEDRGLGFGAGILVGAVAGIAVGFAIARQESRRAGARQRQSARNTP